MKYINCTINEYLNKLAAKTPAPGGGSAAALFGAIACALLEMVLNYSDKNNKFIKKAAFILRNNRKIFVKLVDKDAIAYSALLLSYKKYGRDSHQAQKALKEATLVPFKICKTSYESMKLCSALAGVVSERLSSDLDAAKAGLAAAFKAAKFNVFINIKNIADRKFVISIKKDIVSMEKIYGSNT